jgi:hypothetical protein
MLLFDGRVSDRARLCEVGVVQFLSVAFLVGNFMPVVSSSSSSSRVSQTDYLTGRFIFWLTD